MKARSRTRTVISSAFLTGVMLLGLGVGIPSATAQPVFNCVPADKLVTLGAVYDYPEVNVYNVSTNCTLVDGSQIEPYLKVTVNALWFESTKTAIETVRVVGSDIDDSGNKNLYNLAMRRSFSCAADPWNRKGKSPVACEGGAFIDSGGALSDSIDPFITLNTPWSAAKVPINFLSKAKAPKGIYPAPIPSVTASDVVAFKSAGTPPGLDESPVNKSMMLQRKTGSGWSQVWVGGKATLTLENFGNRDQLAVPRASVGPNGRYRFRVWWGGVMSTKNLRSNWLEFDLTDDWSNASAPTTVDPNGPPPPPAGPNPFPTVPSTTVAPLPPAATTAPKLPAATTTQAKITIGATTTAPLPPLAFITPTAGATYTASTGVPVFITGGSGSYLFEFSQANGRPLPALQFTYNAATFPNGMNIGADKFPGKGQYRVRARELNGTAWTNWVGFAIG
jgi:hypothetical protein